MNRVSGNLGDETRQIGYPFLVAFTGALSALLFVSLELLPALGIFLSLLCPLPVLYLHVLRGPKAGIPALVLALGLTFVSGGPHSLILFLLEYGMLSLVIGEGVRRRLSPARTLTAGTVIPFLAGFGALGLFLLLNRLNALAFAHQQVDSVVQTSVEFYRRMGMESAQIEQIREQMQTAGRFFLRALPALGIIWYAGVAFLNYWLLRLLWLRRGGNESLFLGSLRSWRAPDPLVWGLIASGFAMLAPLAALKIAGLNGLIVFLLVYLLQGFGVLAFLLERWGFPRVFRWIGYLFALATPWGVILLAALGVFDTWLDPRKLRHV